MQYRVEELAAAAGIRVDTVRFYQRRGLLDPPRREGRKAWYAPAHLERLRRIRELGDDGFTLRQIARLLESPTSHGRDRGAHPDQPEGAEVSAPARRREGTEARARVRATDASEPGTSLLSALVEERVGGRTYTRREVAALAGVPESLVVAAESAGLIVPIEAGGEPRYGAADVEMGRAALALLGAGLPMNELFALAVRHARNVTELADAGIDLFAARVHGSADADDGAGDPAATVAALFRDLLPEVTRLVAIHFQRTLVRRALDRLGEGEDGASLQEALERAAGARLEVSWR